MRVIDVDAAARWISTTGWPECLLSVVDGGFRVCDQVV